MRADLQQGADGLRGGVIQLLQDVQHQQQGLAADAGRHLPGRIARCVGGQGLGQGQPQGWQALSVGQRHKAHLREAGGRGRGQGAGCRHRQASLAVAARAEHRHQAVAANGLLQPGAGAGQAKGSGPVGGQCGQCG